MQHRYSNRFAAMLKDKLHVFCCPFFRTFMLQGNWSGEVIITKLFSRGEQNVSEEVCKSQTYSFSRKHN